MSLTIKYGLAVLAAAAALTTPEVGAPGPDAATPEAIGYICSAEKLTERKGGRQIVVQPRMGSGGFPVTAKAEAQTWFDYGLKLAHAFYHGDAKLAFAKAAALDPACAMCVWGQAYAEGPTLNFDVSKKAMAAARAFALKAQGLARTDQERALTAAMVVRYGDRKGSELAFAREMDRLAVLSPEVDDLAILAAHSSLLVARRGDWDQTAKSTAILERVLARSPDNTGAIHFYIHATEFADQSQKALPYADRLAGLAPDASHLVHMAAHTFFRAGRYQDAAFVNAKAIGVEAANETRMNGAGKLRDIPYYGHNLGFGLGGALMSGDRDLAVKFADHAGVAFPAELGDEGLWQSGPAMVAYGRYAPARALALPEPDAKKPGMRIMRHYARGEALALRGDVAGVRAEALAIPRDVRRSGGLGPKARIARLVLDGRVAMLENRPDDAVRAFEAAAKIQKAQFSGNMDPPPWWYPIRRSLAAAHLKAGRPADAARIAAESLAEWPADPLTLVVLARAEEKLGKAGAAERLAAARKAWQGDLAAVPMDAI